MLGVKQTSLLPDLTAISAIPHCLLWPADSIRRRNTLNLAKAKGVLQMKQRPRIYYTETQKALMWDR
ncbi:hypothetical protein, partial [Sideroxydans sp.]